MIRPVYSLQPIRAAYSRLFVNNARPTDALCFATRLPLLQHRRFQMHARGESSAAKAPRRTAKITPCALVAAAATSRARACSRSQPPFCTSCRAETNAQCCRGSYKECEAFSQLPNCQDCCVSHAKETCTRNHSQICQCGVQK